MEERNKLQGFVHSEEIFNMVAHQRHLREDFRQVAIKSMRKDAEVNQTVRDGFKKARINIEADLNASPARLEKINKAMFEDRD